MLWAGRSLVTPIAALLVVGSCGGRSSGHDRDAARPGDGPADASDGALVPGVRADAVTGAACAPQGETAHPFLAGTHVANLDGVTYNSNPPSSGPHCSSWGRRGTYTPAHPLPRCNWVHNLEHGWVVLLYNCPQGCPGVVAALQSVVDNAPTDPDCGEPRLILTPDPALDVTVAATAWGFTWKSNCLDAAAQTSLTKFITAHWGSRGKAPEGTLCFDGNAL